MKALTRTVLPAALLATTLITGACTSAQTNEATKVVQVVLTDFPCVLEALYDGGALFDRNVAAIERFGAAFSIAKECVPDAIQTYNILVPSDPSITIPLSHPPFVDIEYEHDAQGASVEHTYPESGKGNLSTTTNTLSNCSLDPATADIWLSVPFRMYVQSDSDTSPFTYDQTQLDKPGAVSGSDADLIAQKLYANTKSVTGGHYLIVFIFLAHTSTYVPGRTTESFTVTYTASYQTGGALVSRQGKRGNVYAWLYVDGLTITGVSPNQGHTVTASECP